MLLGYIDEIGETGAFISHDHPKYSTSAAFGYAGFVVPEEGARAFGAEFSRQKQALFSAQIAQADHPGRWEFKGADLFRSETHLRYPQQLRVFTSLTERVRQLGGKLFYYADEKPRGGPKETQLQPSDREAAAMRETLNRLARYADGMKQNIMVMIDQVDETSRRSRLGSMYEHIFGRALAHQDMRRILEPPMHLDSELSSGVQFADWVAAATSRAIDYHLVEESRYRWVTLDQHLPGIQKRFTVESKLHLCQRAVDDYNSGDIFSPGRRLYPPGTRGATIADRIPGSIQRAMRRMTGGS